MDYPLQVFSAVATQQSISAAAKFLSISQPAVTQHIKRLENYFSAPLFLRSRHGMTLTQAGMIVLTHTRDLARLEEKVIEKLRKPGQDVTGCIRLGASTSVLQYYLPALLASFKKNHPSVTIDILGGNSTSIIGSLLEQRIDIGLIESPCRRRDLRIEPFFEDEIIVIASPKNPLAKKKSIPLKELARSPFIFREQGSGVRQYVEEHLHRLKIFRKHLFIAQEFPSNEAIKRAVALDMGVGFVSRISIMHEITHGMLKILNVPSLKMRRFFSTILPLGPDPIGLRQIFLSHVKTHENALALRKSPGASKQK